MKTKTRKPTQDSGKLSAAKADELRSMLSDEEIAVRFACFFAKSAAKELPDTLTSKLFEAVSVRETEHAVRLVFKHCESPIERIFFCSCINSFLKSHIAFRFMPPSSDFLHDVQAYGEFNSKLFQCRSFYMAIPADARPKTFLNFLEVTGVEDGGLSRAEAEHLAAEACCLFDLSFMHVIHIVLQPTFPSFAYGKTVRADAAVWVPSDPDVKLIVECDGFEYHGDKEAFSRDRARDRAFGNAGYSVRRYSGQEIHHQPIVAASDLISLIVDQGIHMLSSRNKWERAAVKGQKPPTAAVIDGWRARMNAQVSHV